MGGKRLRRHLALAFALLAAAPAAAEVAVLSGGAVEPGILAAARAFRGASGVEVTVRFATAPAIRRRLGEGEAADVLVVPAALAEELARAGAAAGEGHAPVGRVGVGVAVRRGAAPPDIRTVEAFRREVMGAEALVFNTASTGLYMDTLFDRMGLTDAIRPRTARHPTGEAVLEHLRHGEGRQIGFGAITEILLYRDKGVVLVGPLPAGIQNSTLYVAVPTARGAGRAEASGFLSFLKSPEGLAPFRAAGIEE